MVAFRPSLPSLQSSLQSAVVAQMKHNILHCAALPLDFVHISTSKTLLPVGNSISLPVMRSFGNNSLVLLRPQRSTFNLKAPSRSSRLTICSCKHSHEDCLYDLSRIEPSSRSDMNEGCNVPNARTWWRQGFHSTGKYFLQSSVFPSHQSSP